MGFSQEVIDKVVEIGDPASAVTLALAIQEEQRNLIQLHEFEQ